MTEWMKNDLDRVAEENLVLKEGNWAVIRFGSGLICVDHWTVEEGYHQALMSFRYDKCHHCNEPVPKNILTLARLLEL